MISFAVVFRVEDGRVFESDKKAFVLLEGPPRVVAPPALHSVQEVPRKEGSSATPARARARLEWGGGGERMVLGRGGWFLQGDGFGVTCGKKKRVGWF